MAFCGAPVRDDSTKLNVISGLFAALMLLCVGLRTVTRIPPFRVPFGWDDGLILVATACALYISLDNFVMTHHGFARDNYTIPPHEIETILKLFYTAEIIYCISVAMTKLSILAFYLRIFTEKKFKRATYILMGVVSATLLAVLPANIFQCTPISFMWTGWTGETKGHCINILSLTKVACTINILQDIAVILLPIPFLLRLSLSRKKKVQIVSMFSVGLFVTIASIIRDFVAASYMSVLEADVGVICACMPALKLLLRRVAPGIFGSTVDQSSHLRAHHGSHANSYGARRSMPPQIITKTTTTSVVELPKENDSTIELVETPWAAR
ncbi:hypothetical protein PV08_01349 [Exophiala spinifera]|uniref:Rhodopsin domain-containing protein n=1 Tax=Exophiala spinifera TaxID=91928 RepID=A0A0D1YZM4_9EURO|nr:uncharacterized protein PV08_01349 [Exophiala spinifera]KIW20771.1 hypothetical protein PV08_01349 [Exophiala spinifera]